MKELISFECDQNIMTHVFHCSALTVIIDHHPLSVPPGLHAENTDLQIQTQVMRIHNNKTTTTKRPLNSAGEGGCCLPINKTVLISLPFCEAAARSFC